MGCNNKEEQEKAARFSQLAAVSYNSGNEEMGRVFFHLAKEAANSKSKGKDDPKSRPEH